MFLKSNIPTPALLGVVLNVPITSVVVATFITLELIWTSTPNLTLVSVATAVALDTTYIISWPTGKNHIKVIVLLLSLPLVYCC